VTHDAKSAAYAKRTLHLEKGRLVEAELLATRHAPLVPQEA
jgi:ABC-type lipoprotein export system ATPase subunit